MHFCLGDDGDDDGDNDDDDDDDDDDVDDDDDNDVDDDDDADNADNADNNDKLSAALSLLSPPFISIRFVLLMMTTTMTLTMTTTMTMTMMVTAMVNCFIVRCPFPPQSPPCISSGPQAPRIACARECFDFLNEIHQKFLPESLYMAPPQSV